MHKRLLLHVVLLCLCLGCGTGEYELRIAQRKTTSPFDGLLPAEELAGTRVSIRVPRGTTLLPDGTDPS